MLAHNKEFPNRPVYIWSNDLMQKYQSDSMMKECFQAIVYKYLDIHMGKK